MARLNLILPDRVRRAVKRRVDTGEFASAEAYVEELIRRDEKRRRRRELEAVLLERHDRRNAVVMDDADFAAIGRKVARAIGVGKGA